MASLSRDANGNVAIQFVAGDKRRRTVRLGRVNAKVANEVKLRIETLNALLIARLPMDADSARWVAGIGDDLAAKLAAVGLTPERRSSRLGEFLEAFLERRRGDGAKPNTLANYDRVVKDLLAFLGPHTRMRDITPADAGRFRIWYQEKGLALATQHRQLKFAKHFFGHAVKAKLVPENPFADVTAPNRVPVERRVYVSEADAARLMDVANLTWRAIIALSRYAGLRCPSEVLSLKWEHIDWANKRMTVSSPKTEHLEGRESRVVPIFPALLHPLEDAHALAEPGEVYVVGGVQGDRYRAAAGDSWKNANLRTTMLKLIRRAGLTPWPKPFHALRASCETDLTKRWPLHVTAAWLGHTPRVAISNYLMVSEDDLRKAAEGGAESGAVAVQKEVQSQTDGRCHLATGVPEGPDLQGVLASSVYGVQRQSRGDNEPEYTRQESNL